MSREERAKQFMPFAALKGHIEALRMREKIVVERDEFRAAEKLLFTPGDHIYQLYGTDSMALSYKVYDHLKKLALDRSRKEATE